MENRKNKVVCFGEVLWDNLPTGRKAGGAPMNVAYHLRKLGIDSQIISRVGNDAPGMELLAFMKQIGLPTEFCQLDEENKTSEVLAKILDDHEVVYDILFPVAWDFIGWEERFGRLIESADAFVFGSLAARNSVTRDTLLQMLEIPVYKVLDINLRAPHFTEATVTQLLQQCNLLKLNIHELLLLAGWFSTSARKEADCIGLLQEKFQIDEIIVTKGGSGASYYSPDVRFDFKAYNVQVADTVGSGDSFLAAFLATKLNGASLETSLNYASALGAYIASNTGACPDYNKLDLERFIWHKGLTSTQNQSNKNYKS